MHSRSAANAANAAIEAAKLAEAMVVHSAAVAEVSVPFRVPCPETRSVHSTAAHQVGSRSVHLNAGLPPANHFEVVNRCEKAFAVRHVVLLMPGGKSLHLLT
jgi:hypothetical protein